MFLIAAVTVAFCSGGSHVTKTVSNTKGEVPSLHLEIDLNRDVSYLKCPIELQLGYEGFIGDYHAGIYGFGGTTFLNEEDIKHYHFCGLEGMIKVFSYNDFLLRIGGGIQVSEIQSTHYKISLSQNSVEIAGDKPSYLQNKDAPSSYFFHPFVCVGLHKRYKRVAIEIKYRAIFTMSRTIEGAIYQFDREVGIFKNSMLQSAKIDPTLSLLVHQVLVGIKFYIKEKM